MAPEVNRMSDRPPYRQIADHLRTQITSSSLAPGTKLPSARQLAEEWKVDRLTATRAINTLELEGLLNVEHGRGVFVRERSPRRPLGRDRFVYRDDRGYYFDRVAKFWAAVAPVSISYGPAPDDIAKRLNLAAGAEVLIRARQMGEEGGLPLQLATSFIPAELTRGTRLEQADTGPGGIYDRFEDQGHVLHWIESVTARMPTPDEAEVLRVAPGVPLLRVLRTTLNQDNRPLEVNDTRWAADRFELRHSIDRAESEDGV